MRISDKIQKRKLILKYLIVLCSVIFLITLSSNIFSAAGNSCGYASPCICGLTCQNGGGETGYATIDTCKDGFDDSMEYVHDVNVTDLSSSTFQGGDIIKITVTVKCSSYGDWVSIAYHNGTAWKHKYSPSLCNDPNGFRKYNYSMALDNVGGTHSVRGIINYQGGSGLTCGYTSDPVYSDSDDVSFTVSSSGGPLISIQSLNNPGHNSASRFESEDFNFTAVSFNPISNCSLWNSYGGWSQKAIRYNVQNNTIANFTLSSLSEGTYIWNVFCFDNAGNSDFFDSNYTFYADRTNPLAVVTYPNDNGYINSSNLSISLSIAEANPGKITLTIDGNNETTQNYTGATGQISKAGVAEGAHSFQVHINDSAGNANVTALQTVNIDLTKPAAFDLSSPQDSSQGTDNAGLAPLFDWGSTAETYFNNYTMQISTSSSFSFVNYTRYIYSRTASEYQMDVSLANNNTFYWRVIAYDLAGNYRASSSTFTYITNTSDAAVSLLSPANSFASNDSYVTFSYMPEGPTLSSCTLWGNFSGSWSGNQTNNSVLSATAYFFHNIQLDNGLFRWNVNCNKTDGSNVSAATNYSLYVDNLKPTLNFTWPTPSSNTNTSSRMVVINVTHGESLPSKLTLNWNGTNSTFSYSGSYTNITLTGVSDGEYSYYIKVNDTAGNYNQTESRVVRVDATPPAITEGNSTPSIGKNTTIFNISANITDYSSITAVLEISYPNGSIINRSMGILSNKWYYEAASNSEGRHNASIHANDSMGNSNISGLIFFTVDMAAPQYSEPQEYEDPLSGNAGQVITINVTDGLTAVDTVLISYDNTNHTMYMVSDGIYRYDWNITDSSAKYYSVYINDSAGNANHSQEYNFTINDTYQPSIMLSGYSPDTTDSLDPNITINITANASDRYGISVVILQYMEANESDWHNATMSNLSGLYNASFLPASQNNYTFRILANDTSGNWNESINYTIEIFYDWSWNRTPATFTPAGAAPSQVVSLGTLNIANTGDYMIRFDLSSPADQPTVGYNETEPFNIGPGYSKEIRASAVAPGLNGQYGIDITIDALNSSASPDSLLTGTSIVVSSDTSSQIFAYIYEYDSSVEQGQTNINLTARIMNLGGSTAYNITGNWTIPSGFITRDSANITIESLAAGESAYHTIIASVLSTADITSSAVLRFYSNDSTGSSSSDTKYVSINSPGSSSTPSAPSGGIGSSGSSGSSGGGGGSGTIIKSFSMPDFDVSIASAGFIEMMRGTTRNFTIYVINNGYATELSELTLYVTGFLPGYIRVQPDSKDALGYKEQKEFRIVIEAPRYMKEGRHELTLKAAARAKTTGASPVAERKIDISKSIMLAIHEIAQEDTGCLDAIQASLIEAGSAGLNTIKLKRIINDAKAADEAKNFKMVKELCDEFTVMEKYAYEASEKIVSLGSLINSSKERGLDTSAAERLLGLAIGYFENGSFDKAVERLSDAFLSIHVQERIEQPGLVRNWILAIIISLIAVALCGAGIYKATEKMRISMRISELQKEDEHILNQLKLVQKNYYIDRIMGTGLYRSYLEKYAKRMAVVQHSLIENRIKLLKANNKKGSELARAESKELVNGMAKLQSMYYEKRMIDRNSYKSMFYEFRARHAEVDKEIAKDFESQKGFVAALDKEVEDPRLYFYLHNGMDVKSLHELLNVLKTIDKATFEWHVNPGKNDFANWVRHVFGNKSLADDIQQENNVEGIINMLDIYMSKYKK